MPAPAPSPWQFEQQHEGGDAPVAAVPTARPRPCLRREPPDRAEAPAARAVPEEDAPPARWDRFDAGALERLVVSRTAAPMLVEQFRTLAATLIGAQGAQPIKSIIVTSPSPGDGKTHVAVNLALTLSDSYRAARPADRRRPAPPVAAPRVRGCRTHTA